MKRFYLLILLSLLLVGVACFYQAYAAGTTSTSGITVQTIIDQVRRDTNEPKPIIWSDTDFIQWTNEAVREIANRTGCLQKEKYAITLVEGQWIYPISWTGTHTGSDNASILTDDTQAWTIDALIGKIARNTSDHSSTTITDNDATTVTGVLTGGSENDWDTGDRYTGNPFSRVAIVIHDSNVTDSKTRIFTLTLTPGPIIGHEREQGRPKIYTVWNNEIMIWPVPGSAEAGTNLYVYEVDLPEEITSASDTIKTPFYFDGAILNYVKAKAYFKNGKEDVGGGYMGMFSGTMALYSVGILGKPTGEKR